MKPPANAMLVGICIAWSRCAAVSVWKSMHVCMLKAGVRHFLSVCARCGDIVNGEAVLCVRSWHAQNRSLAFENMLLAENSTAPAWPLLN
ncbi:hypothetical protein DPX16_13541 [Anabarilius grahami]|uniref:Secreted protein n=1 Tax=Anabarilius grahami TaxID=495550 RepID=A0A3N0YCR1_ANAGA|nr:hypothetical protein DPX16_13541 [Anabarilius grahami]